jgi:hypothetical protein
LQLGSFAAQLNGYLDSLVMQVVNVLDRGS